MRPASFIRIGFCCLALCLLAVSCSGRLKKTTEEGLHELSAAGELVTCEYTVSKVIKADDMVPWKIGERKILFCCNAYLKAGVDMTGYNPSKTIIDAEKKSIILVLPPPKILSVNIPAEEIRQVYSHVTGLRISAPRSGPGSCSKGKRRSAWMSPSWESSRTPAAMPLRFLSLSFAVWDLRISISISMSYE